MKHPPETMLWQGIDTQFGTKFGVCSKFGAKSWPNLGPFRKVIGPGLPGPSSAEDVGVPLVFTRLFAGDKGHVLGQKNLWMFVLAPLLIKLSNSKFFAPLPKLGDV